MKPSMSSALLATMLPIVLLTLVPYVLQQASSSSVQPSAVTFDNRTDADTLVSFKASLSNQRGALASWNTTTDFCRWQGVSCSVKHKHRVLALTLSSEGLAGTISPSIGNLTFLKTLNLSGNNLHGEIPSEIGRLSRLQYLDLSNNSFHGELHDSLKNCTSLERIHLGSNKLVGRIPAWLGGLSSLKAIRLEKNNFSGTIPPSLANLSALKEINFLYNQLEGHIPEGLGRLSVLEFLSLAANRLSGTIPTTIFNLSSLISFSVSQNELHGVLPFDLGNRLPKLQNLLLADNHFTGSIPSSLGNITGMNILVITTNNFTGSVPPEIGKLCPDFLSLENNHFVSTNTWGWEFMTFLTNCTRLRVLVIDHNMFGGMLPSSVANLTAQLQVLYVGFNEISGNIPSGISNLVGLNQLQLSNNRFTGILPDSIGRLHAMQILGFENNLLSGFLPSSLGNMTQLLLLYTNNNMFEGPIPEGIGRLQKITAANFSSNKFTGSLPLEIFTLSSLTIYLDLSANYFVGPLPSEVSSLTKLAYLNISKNNLSGPLPDALSNCQSLIDLRLDSNSFNGSIPASINKIRGLVLLNLTKNTLSGEIPKEIGLISGMQELYLSHNNLSGHIPESFENMSSLYKLDLSFNQLDGEVPTHGVFSNMTQFSLDGNLGLCGGVSEINLPTCLQKSMGHSKGKLHLIVKVIVPVSSAVLCFILVLVYIALRKKQKSQSTVLEVFHLIDDKYPKVSYAELVQGTNGFDTNNLLGRGRYGSVYKCRLQLKNAMTTVAVKVFDLQQSGSSKSFISECEALSKIRHRNLISVITCCSSSDSNQIEFKALVFEFMPNGSLDRWIHQDVHSPQPLRGLTLTQRLNIAVDVADAVDYLHSNCDPPIVHCDLKPSNILLNQDFIAHVGDFGLAKILSDSTSEHPINSKSTVGIKGTIGYVAPEYGEGGQVSPCGDTYSFGVVILELFTGMAPTHDMFRDGLTLQKHAENMFPGMLMQIVDPVILSEEGAYASDFHCGLNATEHINDVMFSVTKLALSCSKQAPTERIRMRDAAAEMRIRDRHVKTRQREEDPMLWHALLG